MEGKLPVNRKKPPAGPRSVGGGAPAKIHVSIFSCLLSFSFYQRILSCKKVGSILREARDRVVSLAADARTGVVACHVSDGRPI